MDGRRAEVLPRPLRLAVGWCASILVLRLALVVLLRLLARVAPVTFALVGAVLLAALLQPLATALRRLRFPPALAALTAVVALLVLLAGASALIWQRATEQLPDLRARLADAVERIRTFLVEGPLSLGEEQVDRLADDLVGRLRDAAPSPYAGATTAAETVGAVLLACLLHPTEPDPERGHEN